MNRIRIVRFISALFLALAFLSGCSSTNDYRRVAGDCSYTDDEIAAIRDKAEDGDANSQYELGEVFFAGTCVRLNNSAGMDWMRKSAEQGDARAQSILGWGYSMGAYGVTYNAELAKKWTLKAAEQGDIRSQKQLAYAYLAGRWGLDKDIKKSVYWYQKLSLIHI